MAPTRCSKRDANPAKHDHHTAKEENKALSHDRLGAFCNEPQKDGNRNIMLSDQTQRSKEAESKAMGQMSTTINDIMQDF